MLQRGYLSNASNAVLLLVLLTILQHSLVTSQFCDSVEPSTWDGFVHTLDNSHGFAILCPFEIRGDGCPPLKNLGYNVTGNTTLYITCHPFPPLGMEEKISGCVLDCPGIYFTVSSMSKLILDGITLRGATSSAVVMEPKANLTALNSVFENNSNANGSGGVISTGLDSHLDIQSCMFRNNQARSGGALYLQGKAAIENSQFINNIATLGQGGAIFSGSEAMTDLIQNGFFDNRAIKYGPAVYDANNVKSANRTQNTGCDNTTPDDGQSCNGVQLTTSNSTGACIAFENGCTMFPSSKPSSSSTPSISPLQKPVEVGFSKEPDRHPKNSTTKTLRPLLKTTQTPSSVPSQKPTSGPTVPKGLHLSDLPSLSPSLFPSSEQLSLPSMKPSVSSRASNFPSSTPTKTSAPPFRPFTAAPSIRPSWGLMSIGPTAFPTKFPTGNSHSFMMETSDFPSTAPTSIQTLPPPYRGFDSAPSSQPSLLLGETSTRPTRFPMKVPFDPFTTDFPSSTPSLQQTQRTDRPLIQQATSYPSFQPFDLSSNKLSDQPSIQPSTQALIQPGLLLPLDHQPVPSSTNASLKLSDILPPTVRTP